MSRTEELEDNLLTCVNSINELKELKRKGEEIVRKRND